MDDEITQMERAFGEAARQCLRVIETVPLTDVQHKKLAQWMFGCQLQQQNIRGRVGQRGRPELRKALKYIGKVCEYLIEIETTMIE